MKKYLSVMHIRPTNNSENFQRRLAYWIGWYQKRGMDVDVRYSMIKNKYKETCYSAIILGYNENNKEKFPKNPYKHRKNI